MDGGDRCNPDLTRLATQSDELQLEVMTFLKSKYVDFDGWLDKTGSLHKRYDQLNAAMSSTSQLIQNEVGTLKLFMSDTNCCLFELVLTL